MLTKAIVIFLFLSPNCSGADLPVMPEIEVPVSQGSPDELGLIRDKLAVSLFFRGELADKIIDAGLQERIADFRGDETYSEVRTKLMEWIVLNGSEAAKLYMQINGRQVGQSAAGAASVTAYTAYRWEINPRFLKLIEDLKKAAGDGSASEEEISLAAWRLYDGPPVGQSAVLDTAAEISGRNGRQASEPVRLGKSAASAAVKLAYADYKLDSAGVEREKRIISGIFDSLKTGFEEAAERRDGGEEFLESRRLLNEAFALYKNFVVALSSLKGRSRITQSESQNLEALRMALRSNMRALAALGTAGRVRGKASALRTVAPGSELLMREAQQLQSEFRVLAAGIEKGGESLDVSGRRLSALQKRAEFWNFKFSAYMRLLKIRTRVENSFFPCVLDRLVFEYLSKAAPGPGYVSLKRELADAAAGLDAVLEGVAAGDYLRASRFSGGTPEEFAARLIDLERKLAALESYSLANCRLQFIFWDAFTNPLRFAPGTKGFTACKLPLLQ